MAQKDNNSVYIFVKKCIYNSYYKRLKTTFISTVMILVTTFVFGQHGGNAVIGQSYNYNKTSGLQSVNKLYLSDTSFIIQANVLKNVIADSYVAIFGVSESSNTLVDANSKIDRRINNFISALMKVRISKDDIYVDMTTQTLISDYKVTGNYAEQFISGFEQKKNVIIKFDDINLLDQMIIIASDYGIYDLAKVEYIVTDKNKIYSQLFEEAINVINSKKELYVKATNSRLKPVSQIYGESFYSFHPSQLYQSYTPNISTEYHNYNSYSKRKDLRKNTTYFYDKISYSGFDKVINPIVTEPAVEFVLTLQMKFYIRN